MKATHLAVLGINPIDELFPRRRRRHAEQPLPAMPQRAGAMRRIRGRIVAACRTWRGWHLTIGLRRIGHLH